MRKRAALAGVILAAGIGAVVGIVSCDGPTKHHKATCWKPTYAAAPTVKWAKHPSSTHRHGAGVRGRDVCDGAK